MEQANTQKYSLTRSETYQIKVPGHLGENLSDWIGNMTFMFERDADGHPVTILTGTIDQAALLGVLRHLYSLGVPLISVNCIENK